MARIFGKNQYFRGRQSISLPMTNSETSSTFKQANALMRAGQIQEAIDLYWDLIRRHPNFRPYHDALRVATYRQSTTDSIRKAPKRQSKSPVHSSKQPSALEPLNAPVSPTLTSPFDIALVRIIGNDLYPRHKQGQTLTNLQFILEKEPSFTGCKKIFVVNRIFDEDIKTEIIRLLSSKNATYVDIPFHFEEYANIPICQYPFSCLSDLQDLPNLHPLQQTRFLVALYRLKNNYVMNNNGARNLALSVGRQFARWILPWDGSCSMNSDQFNRLQRSLREAPITSLGIIPMHRLQSTADFHSAIAEQNASEEPQVVLHAHSPFQFNPEIPYGRRPKVELFWHLGVPGPWDTWNNDPWDLPHRPLPRKNVNIFVAGTCYRLPSGGENLDANTGASGSQRNFARQQAIIATLAVIDNKFGLPNVLSGYPKQLLEETLPISPAQPAPDEAQLAVYVDRPDGLGERLRSVLLGSYISKLVKCPLKINWPDKASNEEKFHNIEPASDIFEASFVSSSFISKDHIPSNLSTIKKVVNQAELSTVQIKDRGYHGWRVFQNTELLFVDESTVGIGQNIAAEFDALPFSPQKTSVIRNIRDIPLPNNPVAIHIRGGDIVYGKYRLTKRYQKKAVPLGVALQIGQRERLNGNHPIFFAQDKEVLEICSRDGFSVPTDFYPAKFTGSDGAFADFVLMSRCITIWGGSSGFCALAARISNQPVRRPDLEIPPASFAKSCEEFIRERDNCSDLLRAFHCFMLFDLIDSSDIPSNFSGNDLLDIACSCDPTNPLYLLLRLQQAWMRSEYSYAETVLTEYEDTVGSAHRARQLISHCLGAKYMGEFTMRTVFDSLLKLPGNAGERQLKIRTCLPKSVLESH